MKKLNLFMLCLIVFSCSKSNEDDMSSAQEEPTIVLDAVGSVSEQTPEQAKKTINGKWNVSTSSTGKSAVTCSFYGIEFTDDRYAMAFDIVGEYEGENIDETIYSYGTYSFNEDSLGNVSSVDLFGTLGGQVSRVARLTNVVVEETAGELVATFTVEFTLPEDFSDFPCGSLSGDYSADKDEPVAGADTADEDSTIYKLTSGAWRLSSYSDSFGGTLEEALYEPCLDLYDEIYDELFDELINSGTEITDELEEEINIQAQQQVMDQCDPAAAMEVAFSVYGSYIRTFLDATGETILVFVGDWEFVDSSQTQILIDDDFTLTIDSISDSSAQFTASETEDGETITVTYGFNKVN